MWGKRREEKAAARAAALYPNSVAQNSDSYGSSSQSSSSHSQEATSINQSQTSSDSSGSVSPPVQYATARGSILGQYPPHYSYYNQTAAPAAAPAPPSGDYGSYESFTYDRNAPYSGWAATTNQVVISTFIAKRKLNSVYASFNSNFNSG